MAVYDNLPVFKASYDLLIDVYHLSESWRRDCRYTIGEDLKRTIVDVMIDIYRANKSIQKKEKIDNACDKMVVVKLKIRLLRDLQQMSIKQFAKLTEQTENVSKQLTAWNKSINRK